jgi:hypothetical protein
MKLVRMFVSLSVFAIGWRAFGGEITNTVSITTNMLFYLETQTSPPGAVSRVHSYDRIDYMLIGTETNPVYYRHFPAGNFDFHLYDSNGVEVAKSKATQYISGSASKPSRYDLMSRSYLPYLTHSGAGEFRGLFTPDDVFQIRNSGIYDLEIRIRLCVIMTNNVPDVRAMLDGRNILPSGYPFARDFGILESPPLRIKVIKE